MQLECDLKELRDSVDGLIGVLTVFTEKDPMIRILFAKVLVIMNQILLKRIGLPKMDHAICSPEKTFARAVFVWCFRRETTSFEEESCTND